MFTLACLTATAHAGPHKSSSHAGVTHAKARVNSAKTVLATARHDLKVAHATERAERKAAAAKRRAERKEHADTVRREREIAAERDTLDTTNPLGY